MGTRLLTILGMGRREVVRYRLGENEPVETSSIDAAIVRLFGVTHVTAFGTPEALIARAVDGDLKKGLGDGAWPEALGFERIEWAAGRSEPEFWAAFEQFRGAVASACEAVGEGELIVNLTHGYRTQPLIAQAATLFELEDRRRRRLPHVVVRLLYGALIETGVPLPAAEIWDMTAIVEASAWATAIASLRDHARGDRFLELLTELKRRLGKSRVGAERVPDFKGLGESAKQVVDALVTNRTHLLKTAPAKFRERWEQLRGPLLARLPPLEGPLEDFAKQVAKLETPVIASDDGVRASLEACQWLLDSEQFSALTALLRETVITIEALRSGEREGHEPGGNCSAREAVEHRLGERAKQSQGQKREDLWNELTGLRNDVQHAAYNAHPTDGSGVRKKAEQLLARVRAEAGAKAGRFINVSNHPSAEWDEPQRSGALRLGTSIADIAFPRVDALADEARVVALADEVAREVLRQGPSAVGVQGEHTLTLALVARLQAAGLDCYSATTERKAEVQGNLKTSEFTFQQWRRYPRLAP